MVKIRLTRLGTKHKPFFRIIAADDRAKREGKHLEILGYFDPKVNPPKIKIKMDRLQYWLGVGAQITEPVRKLVEKSQVFAKD